MSAMSDKRKSDLRWVSGSFKNEMSECLDEIDRQEKVILKQGMTINLLTSDQIHTAVKLIREDLRVRGDGQVSPQVVHALVVAAFNAYPEELDR